MTGITEKKYGSINGEDISQFTLSNPSGMIVRIINYGGAITNLIVPDRNGKADDIVLGFDTLEGYLQPTNPHMGSLAGRFANRIYKGQFELDGKKYQLNTNNNGNTLHGGLQGFNRKVWKAEKLPGDKLKLSFTSKDGEEGFPGNCTFHVVYSVTPDNELKIEYSAVTDKPTPVNITNHSYFNLSGGKETTIRNHEIQINAERYIPVDKVFIPTGEIAPVSGTIMDFRKQTVMKTHMDEVEGGGYDHTYVLNNKTGIPELAAAVYYPGNGRYMEVFTTEPGIQFYTGNFLNGSITGKNEIKYVQHAGFCLEAQHFPDSPNQPLFPNTILRPGETFTQTTIYKFSVK